MILNNSLNNQFISEYIIKKIETRLSTKEFWVEDKKRYLNHIEFEKRPRMKNSTAVPEYGISTNT